MDKKFILSIALCLIFLVIFNAIFFIVGDTANHNGSVWISYAFIHAAYFMVILTPILTRKGKSQHVFGFALGYVSTVYFLIELVVGGVFIIVNPESYQAALLIQLILMGIYGITLIGNLLVNEHTAEAEEARAVEIEYIKSSALKVQGLLSHIKDKETKKKVERVYSTLSASPVKSHPNVTEMEKRIVVAINELTDAVYEGNNESTVSLSEALITAIQERNNRLRNLN